MTVAELIEELKEVPQDYIAVEDAISFEVREIDVDDEKQIVRII